MTATVTGTVGSNLESFEVGRPLGGRENGGSGSAKLFRGWEGILARLTLVRPLIKLGEFGRGSQESSALRLDDADQGLLFLHLAVRAPARSGGMLAYHLIALSSLPLSNRSFAKTYDAGFLHGPQTRGLHMLSTSRRACLGTSSLLLLAEHQRWATASTAARNSVAVSWAAIRISHAQGRRLCTDCGYLSPDMQYQVGR